MTSPQATTNIPSSPKTPSTSTTTPVSQPAQASSQSPTAPSISLTPATPTTALQSTFPDEPQSSAEMSQPTSAPVDKSVPAAVLSPPAISEKAVTPAASSSKSTPPSTAVPAPAAKAASTSTPPAGQKKKRRRKGFAGLLLSLGCLSASEFEDDPKEVKQREAAAAKAKEGNGISATKQTTVSPEVKEKPVEAPKTVEGKAGISKGAVGAGAAVAGVAGATGAAALGHGMEKREKEEVVAPPVEPVSPPLDETAGMTSSAVQPPGSGSELLQSTPSRPTAVRRESEAAAASTEQTSSGGYTEMPQTEATDSQDRDVNADAEGEEEYAEEEYEDEEDRLIAQGGIGIPLDEYGRPAPLLPPIAKEHTGRKCLVLDLDETLLHSSFKMLPSADYIVPVEIESQTHNVYVIKRPGVDRFLTEMGKVYEVVVFTASLSKYADPVLDMLDPDGVVKHRLFRESCYNHKGNYVKDLSQLGRTMETCIILDNSPASYIFHPNNAVPVSTWFNDPHDTELTDLCPFLTDLAEVDDIRGVLDGTL